MNQGKTIYALGFFDGVHLGHAQLLQSCRVLADELGCKAGVITFESHPDALVSGKFPGLINTIRDRDVLLRENFSMDTVVSLHFDREMMETPWQDFFRMLLDKYHAAGLVCGEDFRFGYRGQGDSQRLLELCREAGIPCIVEPQKKLDGLAISSTHIRNLLQMGLMGEAVRFMGHPYVLSAAISQTQHPGRQAVTPAANISLPGELLMPRLGVYALFCLVDGVRYPAIADLGTRPTMEGSYIALEIYLLEKKGPDLAGKELRLEFYEFLRPELRFPNVEQLQEAIYGDARRAREILSRISK